MFFLWFKYYEFEFFVLRFYENDLFQMKAINYVISKDKYYILSNRSSSNDDFASKIQSYQLNFNSYNVYSKYSDFNRCIFFIHKLFYGIKLQ